MSIFTMSGHFMLMVEQETGGDSGDNSRGGIKILTDYKQQEYVLAIYRLFGE